MLKRKYKADPVKNKVQCYKESTKLIQERTKYNVTKKVQSWSSKEQSTMLQRKYKVDLVKNKVQWIAWYFSG